MHVRRPGLKPLHSLANFQRVGAKDRNGKPARITEIRRRCNDRLNSYLREQRVPMYICDQFYIFIRMSQIYMMIKCKFKKGFYYI